jgi:hypothetical protein
MHIRGYRDLLIVTQLHTSINVNMIAFYTFMENITIYAALWNRQRPGALVENIQRESLKKKYKRNLWY